MDNLIRNKVMLANLSIGVWGAKVAAKEVAREAEAKANAKNGTYTANKKLADGVVELDRIHKKRGVTRAIFYKQSVPWFDKGTRGYKGDKTFDLTQQMMQEQAEFDTLVNQFMLIYPQVVAGKQYDLGADYNPKEYPPPDVVRAKFKFKFDYFTIPNTGNDLRDVYGIPADQVDDMIKSAEDRLNQRLHGALSSSATRLFKCIEKMHEKLSVKIGDEGSVFRDSLVKNLVEIIDIMPDLNITDDPALKALTQEAKKLTVYSPSMLREDAIAREHAAKQAGALASKLSSLFATDTEEKEEE